MSSADTDRLAELERRLQALEDSKQIEELQHRYIRCLADRDWQGCVDCYADDAVSDLRSHGVKRGKKEIEELIVGELGSIVKSRDAYVLSSPTIEVDGDRATGEWTWHRHQCEFRTAFGLMRVWGPWEEGRYRCEYSREADGWKLKNAWFRVVSPTSDDELAQIGDGEVIGAPRASQPT